MKPTPTTLALTTLDRVLHELGKDPGLDQHAELNARINGVSSRFTRACYRDDFNSATYVHDGSTLERLIPFNACELYLRNPPITAVATLKPYADADALTESTNGYDDDFVVHQAEGRIELINGHQFWYMGLPVVEITYTGGFSAAQLAGDESGIEDVVAKQVAWEYKKRRTNAYGVESISTEGTTVNYTADATWLPEVKEMITLYRVHL